MPRNDHDRAAWSGSPQLRPGSDSPPAASLRERAAAYILQAFEMVVPPEGHDPADCYLPAAVFDILDVEMAATGIAGTTLVAAWRQCAPDRYGFIADPLASIALFAEEARRGRPAALEAINKAKAAMKKAPKAA